MENEDQEEKSDGGSDKSEKEKLEEKKKQDARLAERKGQRPAFPFKRRNL